MGGACLMLWPMIGHEVTRAWWTCVGWWLNHLHQEAVIGWLITTKELLCLHHGVRYEPIKPMGWGVLNIPHGLAFTRHTIRVWLQLLHISATWGFSACLGHRSYFATHPFWLNCSSLRSPSLFSSSWLIWFSGLGVVSLCGALDGVVHLLIKHYDYSCASFLCVGKFHVCHLVLLYKCLVVIVPNYYVILITLIFSLKSYCVETFSSPNVE